jgi:hypothetical protein
MTGSQMKKSSRSRKTPPRKAGLPARQTATHQEIAAAAYSIWEQQGRPAGRDVEHWLQAELQICGRGDGQSPAQPFQL